MLRTHPQLRALSIPKLPDLESNNASPGSTDTKTRSLASENSLIWDFRAPVLLTKLQLLSDFRANDPGGSPRQMVLFAHVKTRGWVPVHRMVGSPRKVTHALIVFKCIEVKASDEGDLAKAGTKEDHSGWETFYFLGDSLSENENGRAPWDFPPPRLRPGHITSPADSHQKSRFWMLQVIDTHGGQNVYVDDVRFFGRGGLAANGLDAEIPDAVVDVRAIALADGNVRVSWSCVDLGKQMDPVTNVETRTKTEQKRSIVGFVVLIHIHSVGRIGFDRRVCPAGISTYDVKGLTSGVPYLFQVIAVGTNGEGVPSRASSVVIPVGGKTSGSLGPIQPFALSTLSYHNFNQGLTVKSTDLTYSTMDPHIIMERFNVQSPALTFPWDPPMLPTEIREKIFSEEEAEYAVLSTESKEWEETLRIARTVYQELVSSSRNAASNNPNSSSRDSKPSSSSFSIHPCRVYIADAMRSSKIVDLASLLPPVQNRAVDSNELTWWWRQSCQWRHIMLFLSFSAGEDTALERMYFHRYVAPTLRDVCAAAGVSVSVVDPNAEPDIRHKSFTEYRKYMLSQCLESSKNTRGAIACLFLSTDTYWYSDLPAIVPEDEMDSLLDAVETDAFSPNPGTNHVKEDIQDLLTKIRRWYKKDVNGMPPVYVLQPPYLHQTSKDSVTSESQGSESLFEEVSVIRKALFDASVRAGAPEHEVSKWLSSNAEKDWRFTQLFTSIRSSQDSASQRKKPSKSKTQAQLRDAVLPVIRDLEGLREDAFKLEGRGFSEDNTGAKKKIESTLSEKEQMVRKYWTISKQRRRLLYELRNQMRTQNGKRTLNFQAPWKAMGMELGHPDHARYVRELGASFVVLMESRLERGGARNQQQIQETPSDFKCCWCCRGQSNVAWGGSTWEHMHGWEAEAALHAVFASKEADGYVNLPALINEEGDSIRDPAQQLMGLINDRILQSTSEVGEARDDDTPKGLPILLYGPSSTGKTATMCHVATKLLHPPEATQQQSDESYESGSPKSFSNPVVVFRSVGATFGTLSVTSLVQGICLQIRRAYGKDRGKFQSTGLVDTLVGDDAPTPKLLRTHFSEALALATEECPLVVFLDGLDLLGSENISPNKPGQGAETGESMAANYPWTWLPYRVPKNVCLVISMRDFVEVRQTSNTSRKPTAARPSRIFHTTMGWYGLDPQRDAVRLCSLNPVTAQYLLLALLRQQKRILQPFQIDAIWQEHTSESGRSTPASPASHNTNFSPSAGYVRILASVASKWRSWDHWESNHSTHSKLFPPSPQLQLFLDAIFDDVEEEHGKRLVQSVLGLLLTARLGLRHSELCDIISGDDDTLGYPGIPDTVFDKMECTQPKGGKIQSEVETKIKARRLPPIALSCLLDELVGLGLVDARIVDPDKNANGCAEHFVPSHHDCLKVFMQMRYLPTPKSEMHYSQMLAEYFSGELSEKFKARLLHPQSWRFSEDRVEEYGINSTDAGGDEGDQKRPRRHSLHCRHKGGKGKANIRRLTELPRALRKSQLYTKAMDMFSNFEMWEAAFEADSRRFSCSNRTDGSHQLDGQNSKSIVTDLLNEMRKLLQDVSVMSGDKHKRIKSSENSISDKAPADEYFRLKSFQSIIERAKGFLKKYPELTLPFAANSDLQLNMESIISKISNDRISNKAQPWLKLLDKPANGLKMGEFNVKGHAILSVAWSFARPNCFAVCSNDGNVTIQNSLTKASVLQTTTGFGESGSKSIPVMCTYHPSLPLLLCITHDNRIRVLNTQKGDWIQTVNATPHKDTPVSQNGVGLTCCSILKGGVGGGSYHNRVRTLFATADNVGMVRIWYPDFDLEMGDPWPSVAAIEAHGAPISSVAFCPEGERIATTSLDGSAAIWSLSPIQRMFDIRHHEGTALNCCEWSPIIDAEHRIAFAAEDGSVSIWNVEGRHPVLSNRLSGDGVGVKAIAWSPDGNTLATASSDGLLKLWDWHWSQCLCVIQAHSDAILSLDWHPSGSKIVTGSADGTVRIWSPDAIRMQVQLRRSTGSVDDDVVQGYSKEAPQVKTSVVAAAWCADHKRFVAVKSDHKVEFWDPADGSCTAQRQTLEVSDLIPLQTGALSADGKRCLSVSSAGEVIVWAPSSGEVQRRIKLENSKKVRLLNPRANISWHPKGAAIVCTVPGTELESTFVWKIASAGREETANEVPQLWFVGDPTSSAVRIQSTFSPDGTKILQLTSHGATVWSWAEEVESTPIQWMLEITGSWTLSTWSKSATSEAQRILLVEAAHPNIRIKPNMGEAIIVDGQTGNKICGLTRVLSHTFLHATGCSFTLDGQHAAVSFGMTDSYGDMHVDSEALIVLYDCVQGYALSSVGRPDLGIFGHVLVCGECQGEEETSETSVFGTGHREEDVFVFRLKRPCNEGHNIKVGAEQELEKEQLSNLLAPLVQEESDQLDGEGDDADEDGDENAAISASRWSLVQHRKQERVLQSELEELKHKVVVLEDSNEQKEKMLKQEMEVRKAREQELAKQRRAVEEEKKRKEEEVARKQEEFKKHLDEELAKRQLIEKEQEAMKQLMNALTSQLDEKDRELQKAKSKACSLL